RRQKHGALACIELPHVRHVVIVRPCGDRRPLDELMRRGADGRPEAAQRIDSVLNTTTFVRSPTSSAETGGSSNQSSEYASSEQTRKPCVRARSASSS